MPSPQAQGKIAEVIGWTQTAPARSEVDEVPDIDIANALLKGQLVMLEDSHSKAEANVTGHPGDREATVA